MSFRTLYYINIVFLSPPTFDKKGKIIDVDTFYYPSIQLPFSLFFPSLVNDNRYFQLNYELDTSKVVSYFKIKIFDEDSSTGAISKVKEKIIYDPYTIKDPGFIFIRNIKPDSVPEPSFSPLRPFIRILRGEKNGDWWVFKFYNSYSSYEINPRDTIINFYKTDSGPAVTTIALYKFTDGIGDSIELTPIRVYNFRSSADTIFYPHNSGLYFSPNLDLAVFLTQKKEFHNVPGAIELEFDGFYHLHFLKFNRESGELLPIDGADSLGASYVEFLYNFDSIPDTTNVLEIPFLAECFNFWRVKVDLNPVVPFFSNDGKRLYIFRWQVNLDSLNINYIKSKVQQWLPNNYTPFDIFQRLNATRKINFMVPPEYFIGLMGSPLFYSFFPTYTGKWYLINLSFADSLSPSFLRSKPIYMPCVVRFYELKNMDSTADKISIHFLKSDTLIYPRAPQNDSDYVPFYVPPFKDSLIFSKFFQGYFCHSKFNIYHEYLYPPRGLLALGPTEVCEGEEIHLEASIHLYPDTNARYYWFGPNGWQDSGRTVVIRNAQLNHSGEYVCKAVFADTTFTSEVYVQVVPRPRIAFEEPVPRYICNRQPFTARITYPRWREMKYFIRWSTGDTVEAITIENTGRYWVKVWDELGCMDSVGFEVEFVDTVVVGIKKEKEYLCTGERMWLEVDAGWENIRWSTGDTTRRIYVDRGGRYSVEVRNSYGCSAWAESEIEEIKLELELPTMIDFGRVRLGESEERRVAIINRSGSKVKGWIRYVGSERFGNVPQGRLAIEGGDSIVLVLAYTPNTKMKEMGKMIVDVDSPCVRTFEIELKGQGMGVVKVWTIDSVVVVGSRGFCIPIYSKVIVGERDTVVEWSGEVGIEKGLIHTSEGRIEGEERVFGVGGFVSMDTLMREIGRICGDMMLPRRKVVAIDLRNFDFGEWYEVEEVDGALRVIGVCQPELSQVEMLNPMKLEIVPNPAGDKFMVRLEGEAGNQYRLRIMDMLGRSIETTEGEFERKGMKIHFDAKRFGSGLFFVQLCSGNNCIVQPLWIW